MVYQIRIADGMDEHHQTLPMHGQPRDHLTKQRGLEGQLAAPIRMRAHGFFMHPAHLQREPRSGSFAQGAGLRNGFSVEINVGMKAVDARAVTRLGGRWNGHCWRGGSYHARMIAERLSKRVMALKSCSRSEAERYIANGFVRVNGNVVEEPQARVSDERVEIDDNASLLDTSAVTLLLNKPPGFETIAALEHASRQLQPAITLLRAQTLAPAEPVRGTGAGQALHGIRPLKRHFTQLTACVPLETAASGLVVFTQDWRIARKLADDAAIMEHELMVEVAGEVSPEALQKLNHRGLREDSSLPPVKASVSSTSDTTTKLRFAVKGSHLGLVLYLCERAGLHIESMKRIRVGRVGLGQVPMGQWRYLLAHEKF